ncbi:MAG: stage V sporulation protein AB [Lachnospiraceae bacterium]|nr:stage V sporulation protein AB [Lachnospiraceae bacterium]
MWIKEILLVIIGLGSGFVVAAGVFALVSAIGVITRMAGVTHTGKYARLYEDAIMCGATIGNIVSVYKPALPIGSVGLALYGIFSGIYVGVLAVSLAESINATSIFTRRSRIKGGLGFIVTALALGKGVGSFIMFFMQWG